MPHGATGRRSETRRSGASCHKDARARGLVWPIHRSRACGPAGARPFWPAGAEAALVFVFLLILHYTWVLRGRGAGRVAGIVALVVLAHARRRESPTALGLRRAILGWCVRAFGPAVAGVGLLIVRDGVAWRAARAQPRRHRHRNLLFLGRAHGGIVTGGECAHARPGSAM